MHEISKVQRSIVGKVKDPEINSTPLDLSYHTASKSMRGASTI